MKKLLLLVTVLLTTVVAQAQVWWGYFNESDFEVLDTSIGLGTPVPFMTGIYIPGNHEQVGSATVKAVRVYIVNGVSSTISDMKVWISKREKAIHGKVKSGN